MNHCNRSPEDILSRGKGLVRPILVQKIPRPPNAFMLYANEHRKSMAHLYPADSNKQISRRLGQTWKDLNMPEKNRYFQKAKDIDMEHKRKYPGYVYNPKDARMRKAMRSSLRDRSMGAPPMLVRTGIGKMNMLNTARSYKQLIITDPSTHLQSPLWDEICDLSRQPKGQELYSVNGDSPYYTDILSKQQRKEDITSMSIIPNTSFGTTNQNEEQVDHPRVYQNVVEKDSSDTDVLPSNFEEERILYKREKLYLEAAEDYTKVLKQDKLEHTNYLPISATKFVKNPELFTNNAEYHKEYIIKYFNHIPDYEIINVTMEDGRRFPYVTIPNLFVLDESNVYNK